MPERIPKRTYNWFLVFFIGLLFFQGVLLSAHTAQAQAEVDWQDPVTTQVSTPKDTTTQAKGGTTEQAKKPTEEGCSWISSPIVCAAQYILIQIRDLFYWIASGAATMFVWAVHPDNISGPNGLLNKASLYNLWKFIRDFFNLSFILILLVSAFATIFQVESFSIRKIFFNILFAALIINFSFPITRFLIDLTNVPMYYFINITVEGVGSGGLKITEALLGSSGVSAGVLGNPSLPILLMNIIFIFLFAISLLVLALMMMIRVLALTLLLVFSPLGFAATLLPGMQDLGRKWWSKFWSYAFFGPAAALVLLVAVRFMNEIGRDGTFRSTIDTATDMSAGPPQSVVVAQLTFFVIPIILIWTAIGMANSFSIAGATKVTGMGYGAARWTGKKLGQGAWGAAKYVDRKVEKKMADTRGLRWFSPRVLATAVKNRSVEQKHKDEAKINQGAARVQDKLNAGISRFVTINPKKWFHPGIDSTNHEFEQTQHQANEEKKQISDVSTNGNYVMNELKDAITNKQANKADAALQLLAQNNDMNDMLLAMGKEYGAEVDENGEVVVSSENMLKVLPKILAAAGEKNTDLLAQRMMVIGEKATGSGNYAFGGMVQFNEKADGGHGKFEIATPKQQAAWAAGKVKNLESQKRQTSIHPDSLFTRTDSGFGDINGEVAKEIIGTFTGGDVEQVNRSRDDLKEAIHKAYQNKSEKFMELYDSNDIFKQYVQTVVKMKRGIDYKSKMSSSEFEKNNPSGVVWTPVVAAAAEAQEAQVQKARAAAQPGEAVSPGGIIISTGAGGGPRKST